MTGNDIWARNTKNGPHPWQKCAVHWEDCPRLSPLLCSARAVLPADTSQREEGSTLENKQKNRNTDWKGQVDSPRKTWGPAKVVVNGKAEEETEKTHRMCRSVKIFSLKSLRKQKIKKCWRSLTSVRISSVWLLHGIELFSYPHQVTPQTWEVFSFRILHELPWIQHALPRQFWLWRHRSG